jgi:CHAT domain-containing protein
MRIQPGKTYGLLWLFCCCITSNIWSQSDVLSWQQKIDQYISSEQPAKADSLLKLKQSQFLSSGEIDSLYQFPGKVGRIANMSSDKQLAAKKAEGFISYLKSKTSNARTLFKAYLDLDNFYVFLGDDQNALKSSLKALDYAQKLPDVTPSELGRIHYSVGGNYYALYDLTNALTYFKHSAAAYERSTNLKKEVLADAYNGVAAAMWTLNKLDSAQIYYERAIAVTKESDLIGFDRTYYIVAFQFNLALVIDAQGRLSEAIELKKKIIQQLQQIIDGSEDPNLVKKAKRLLASAVSNLAAFYNDTGYLTKAYEMLQYAYEKKKEVFEISSPRLATTLTQLALTEYELKEFDKSIATSQLALRNLEKSTSRYLSVEADIYAMLAKTYAAKEDKKRARALYEKSHALYREAYPTSLSQEYLIMLRDYTQFLADMGEREMSIELANQAYTYISENLGANNFPILKEISNLSEVYFKAGDYKKAHQWAQKGNALLDDMLRTAASDIDSVQIEFRRPEVTVLEVRSLYEITTNRNIAFLKAQIEKIDKAIASLEKRKTTTFRHEDLNSIMEQYHVLSTESEKMHYELFERTGDPSYLSKIISLHESGIYNRIRTQFSIKNDIRFGNLPDSILNLETNIKTKISTALSGASDNRLNDYFTATENWKDFLEFLKLNYPKYYALRYETITEDLGNIQQNIPENTIVVRYLFLEDELLVFVINRATTEMIALNSDNLENLIDSLGEDQSDVKRTSAVLSELYDKLWRPIEHLASTEKVIIIPDGLLFNLSFETLTPKMISAFGELATNSLLARHIISYNYSIFLLKQPSPTFHYKKNFVAFAPEFNEEMKTNYRFSITDSLEIDKTYIRLLPQPFSAELVKKYSDYFNGKSFLNEHSTKQIFKHNAKEHKIIHIGTHAESNNITPEFSRLIFAKNVAESGDKDDNSLFTYEIYDYNLSSNLTILTACETGKPTFDPGEGMISLAHAFSYAGSESMLTSLWKIDEKSSNEILDYFYNNISDGMHKDKALQQAKLSYISNAQGRTIAPQYWAGLVLIGDSQPIELNTGFPFWPWFIGGLIALTLIFVIFRRWNG